MSQKLEVLNIHHHRHLKLGTHRGYDFAQGIGQVDVVLREFRTAASAHPIVFIKESGNAHPVPVALLEGQQSITAEGRWPSHFLPLILRVYPFALAGVGQADEPVICIDRASALLSETDGMPLFLPDGGPAPALEQTMGLLSDLNRLQLETLEFSRVLAELGLFTPLTGVTAQAETYRVDETRLDTMSVAAIRLLRKRGWLAAIYAHLVSLAAIDAAAGAESP